MASDAHPPGPKGNWLLGNLLQLRQGFLPLAKSALQTHGDLIYLRAGLNHIYVVNHPDYIHEVLVAQADKFYKTKLVKRVFAKTFGSGIGFSDGAFHKQQRSMVQPALHTSRLGKYALAMIDHTKKTIVEWQPDQQYELRAEMTKLTMEVVAETLFGSDIEGLSGQVSGALTSVVDSAKNQFKASLIKLPDWIPTAQRRQEQAAIQRLDSIIAEIIRQRRSSGEDKGDLLSKLLLATEEHNGRKMTDKQARDEAITLFLGGYETTSLALTWAWYLLLAHPEVEAKVVAEIDTVLTDQDPTLADLNKLIYMEMTLMEALRMYPPLWVFTREPIEDVKIGGYTLRKGSTVFISPYITQRDPRYFPDPDRFIPERFALGSGEHIPRYAYFPFGAGPRVCIGQSFALTEMKLVLALMLRTYQLRLVDGQQVTPKTSANLRPREGIYFTVATRA